MGRTRYRRFENTYEDLLDCYGHLEDNLSESEDRYKKRLIELCKRIGKENE